MRLWCTHCSVLLKILLWPYYQDLFHRQECPSHHFYQGGGSANIILAGETLTSLSKVMLFLAEKNVRDVRDYMKLTSSRKETMFSCWVALPKTGTRDKKWRFTALSLASGSLVVKLVEMWGWRKKQRLPGQRTCLCGRLLKFTLKQWCP